MRGDVGVHRTTMRPQRAGDDRARCLQRGERGPPGAVERVGVGARVRGGLVCALGLEGLGAQLLILVGDQVDAQREVVDGGTLAAEIEDANLGVRHTTVEARLRVRLQKQLVSN